LNGHKAIPLLQTAVLQIAALLSVAVLTGCTDSPDIKRPAAPRQMDVHPDQEIQPVLDRAAELGCRKVVIHAGVYRPATKRQALIWLNAKHDGIHVIGDGDVVLRADNQQIASAGEPGFPAVVNHVVYFGDGVTAATVLENVRITGANGFQTTAGTDELQPETGVPQLTRDEFFFSDGGGVKIFGRSYPTLINVHVFQNDAQPCGGGVSVEHRGFREQSAVFRNCIFEANTCRITGSAVDVLPGSAATFENCLFAGNLSNNGVDDVSREGHEYNAEHGCGALTVFHDSRVNVERCTFTGNRNGVDDKGRGNAYVKCLFWKNDAPGGVSPGSRYECDILHTVNVRQCAIGGSISDLRGSLDPDRNRIDIPDPQLNSDFVPQAAGLEDIGYRPVTDRVR